MHKNLKIGRKLLLVLAIPIIGMVMFAALHLRDNLRTLGSMRTTQSLITVSISGGALVHELQKERGLTAGYIGSRGEKFKEELAKQRQIVDSTLEKFQATVSVQGARAKALQAALDVVNNDLQRITSIRSAADTLTLEPKESFGYYTGLIASCQNVAYAVVNNAATPDIALKAFGYTAFQAMKESTGQLRATVNGILTADMSTIESYQRVVRVTAAEELRQNNFQRFADPLLVREFQDQLSTAPPVRQSAEMLKIVLDKGVGSGFGIAPEQWFATITAKINLLKEMEDKLAASLTQLAEQQANQARRSLLFNSILTAILSVMAIGLGIAIIAGITKPLQALVAMLRDIAQGEGDLTRRLAEDRRDELGDVAHWFNQFVANIHGIITQVSGTTTQVATASSQLHSTAEQIATAAEEVAAQSTTVATASEEMSATSNDISHNCALASDSANRASQTANNGAEVVKETICGMQAIADKVRESAHTVSSLGARSDQIGAIVGTIEDIADQTNLLALNAAIEAARAGEQGRGFAVVADEVRALAERTTKATHEIGEMIKAIQSETGGAVASMEHGVREVEKGMDSSRRSGEALQQILEAISDVNLQVQQIATAAEEQTAVTGEISSNIHQITDVVQDTAKGAHQTADAASGLSHTAHDLQQLVNRFKL
jgi:methyl-accepting chemotaxis protein